MLFCNSTWIYVIHSNTVKLVQRSLVSRVSVVIFIIWDLIKYQCYLAEKFINADLNTLWWSNRSAINLLTVVVINFTLKFILLQTSANSPVWRFLLPPSFTWYIIEAFEQKILPIIKMLLGRYLLQLDLIHLAHGRGVKYIS